MNDNLSELDIVELENVLWIVGMNLHNESDTKQREYLDFIRKNSRLLGSKLYYKCLTNILHVFYANMNDSNRQIYLEMLLSVDTQSIDSIGVGDVLEVLGIIVKGCDSAQILQLFAYVKANVGLCLNDASALVSVCNCFRYMYPEVQAGMQKSILSMLLDIIDVNPFPELESTLHFTFDSIREVAT